MLAEELLVVDGDSSLWQAVRPLLHIALQLEQNEDSFSWHSWNKQQISTFLKNLPSPCSLVAGVWETAGADEERVEYEQLTLGVVCEVIEGEVWSIRTFESLQSAKPVAQWEPGYEDALEIMRLVREQVAPVAWALFIDKASWDEWLFAGAEAGGVIEKGDLLAAFARQGRCVLMGSQVAHSHHHQE